MSKIDDLIKELCPDGVSVRSLGDLEDSGIIKLGRGMVISKNDIADNPGDYPVYSSSATGLGEFGRYSKYMFDDERITWSVDGGGRFFHRKTHKYSVTNVSGWIKVNDANIITKYLYYVLDNLWLTKKFDYVKKAHPSVIRNEYKIPIPPLEVQKEIVRVLDSFTELEVELEVELEARKKQYEYYRNSLLAFDKNASVAQWKTLESVCEAVSAGGDLPNNYIKGNTQPTKEFPYPIYSNGTELNALYGYSDSYKINKKAVTISARGTIGYHAVRSEKFTPIVRLITLIPDTKIITVKFLNYALNVTEIGHSGGSIPQLTVPNVKKIKIPVPTLTAQERIVSILDKFDALVNDISTGLPAEIEARRKQYEYYRNKLLTFKELECSR